MKQHWTVGFIEYVGSHMDVKIGIDPDEELIERRMMKLAKRNPVADDRLTFGLGIRNDMGGIQEFLVAQTATRALFPVGIENPDAKGLLVDALTGKSGHIDPSAEELGIVRHFLCGLFSSQLGDCCHVVYNNGECKIFPIIAEDIDRPGRHVFSRGDSMEIDEWDVSLHGFPETDVVSVEWIGTAILVLKQSIRAKSVVVRTVWRSNNGKRHLTQYGGLEYSLRCEKGNAPAIEHETFLKQSSWKHVTMNDDLLCKPFEGGDSDFSV